MVHCSWFMVHSSGFRVHGLITTITLVTRNTSHFFLRFIVHFYGWGRREVAAFEHSI